MAARCGIEQVSRSASYIGTWLEALQNDKRFTFTMPSTPATRLIISSPAEAHAEAVIF